MPGMRDPHHLHSCHILLHLLSLLAAVRPKFSDCIIYMLQVMVRLHDPNSVFIAN